MLMPLAPAPMVMMRRGRGEKRGVSWMAYWLVVVGGMVPPLVSWCWEMCGWNLVRDMVMDAEEGAEVGGYAW